MLPELILISELLFADGTKAARPFSSVTATPKTITPPSSKAGLRPDCGMGKKAVLQNDEWVCVALFD